MLARLHLQTVRCVWLMLHTVFPPFKKNPQPLQEPKTKAMIWTMTGIQNWQKIISSVVWESHRVYCV